jgi:hypothetical protein
MKGVRQRGSPLTPIHAEDSLFYLKCLFLKIYSLEISRTVQKIQGFLGIFHTFWKHLRSLWNIPEHLNKNGEKGNS